LICPPSNYIKDYFGLKNWLDNTINKLKKYTDRKIIIRDKNSSVPLSEDIDSSWAVVTCQSTVCIETILRGKPSFCDEISMGNPVSLNDLSRIESPFYPDNRIDFIDSLLANQFTLEEIKSGVAWKKVK
jgi:hypothetical protein